MPGVGVEHPPSEHSGGRAGGAPLLRWERWLAGGVGAALLATGSVAIFVSDNDIGTGALLVIAALLLLIGLVGLVPTRISAGGAVVDVERPYVDAVNKLLTEATPSTQEEVREALGAAYVATSSVGEESSDSVREVVAAMVRATGAAPKVRDLYNRLEASGWVPNAPPKSRYVRWVFSGQASAVTVYQSHVAVVVASQSLRELVRDLPGAHPNAKGEVQFDYRQSLDPALTAIERLQAHADRTI